MKEHYVHPVVVGVLIVFSFGMGWLSGSEHMKGATTAHLTHEAVREKAGTWTAGENGEAVFKWLACIPAKPQEVKK